MARPLLPVFTFGAIESMPPREVTPMLPDELAAPAKSMIISIQSGAIRRSGASFT
jgi:hypothetical protein